MNKHKHHLRLLFSAFLLIYVAAFFTTSQAGTVKCPPYSVTLTGTATMPGGVTYTETLVMHKNTGGSYDGGWHIDSFMQENVYPYNVDHPMPVAAGNKVQFGHGQWMNCFGQTYGNIFHNECTGGNTKLDVVGNKIGSTKTGIWIGAISGTEMSLKFDQSNPYEPVIKGTIVKLTGGNLALSITQPSNNKKYVFSENSPGKLTITAKANVNPASKEGDVTWELPEIAGSTRTVTPASAKGSSIIVEFENLPTLNGAFGKKTIKASLDSGTCKVSDEKEVSVFFPRDAKNNPQGDVPNWFYYWKQTSACKGPSKYGDSTGQCGNSLNRYDGTIGYYRYKHLDQNYYVCDLSGLGPTFPFVGVQVDVNNNLTNANVTGIDTFAAACYHENAHYSHFKKWWFVHKATHPFSPTEDFNKNSIKDSVEALLDKDGDLIPDSEEPALDFNPNEKYTFPGPSDDEEILTWKEEALWKIGSANKEDWAKPGKQWN